MVDDIGGYDRKRLLRLHIHNCSERVVHPDAYRSLTYDTFYLCIYRMLKCNEWSPERGDVGENAATLFDNALVFTIVARSLLLLKSLRRFF